MVRPVVVCCLGFLILLGKAFPQEPSQFETLLASAQQAQARGDFQAAAEFYRQAVAIQPQLAELRANLGLMYYQIGNDDRAIEAFREAIRLKPGLLVPNLFLGLDYVRLKRFDEAIPYLKRAVSAKPTDIQAQIGLAQAYSGSRKPRLAITSYLHVTQLDPGNADVWYYLGTSYLQQVESDASVMLARHKDSAYLQALTAEALFDQGAFGRAANFYEKTLALRTFPPETHANYGFALLNQHDNRSAEREMNAELAANPGSLTARLGLARLHLEQGRVEECVREIENIAKTDLGFLKVNAALFNAGLPEAKRADLQHALEKLPADEGFSGQLSALFRNPSDGSTTEILAANRAATDAQRRNAHPDGALELYARGRYAECSDLLISRVQLLPAKSLELLASCAYSAGDYHNAQQAGARLVKNPATEAEGLYWEIRSSQKLASNALAHASQINSSSPKLHVLLGDLYREKNSNREAAKEYRKALELQPHDTGALFGLCLALLADSRTDEALEIAQTNLKEQPNDPELNTVMGEILCDRADFSGAEKYLEKGLNSGPRLTSHVHALLGKVYAETNRPQQAIAQLKLALPDDTDGTLHYQIGRLYLKVGDRNSAKQAFDVTEQMKREGVNTAIIAMH